MMRLPALALAAVVVAATPSADAQIFTGVAANPAVEMPAAPAAPAATAVPSVPSTILRTLPATLDGLRVTGETGDLRWPVYFTAEQARTATRFRLGYLASISVLPDTSFVELTINGRKIGTDVIDASGGLRIVELEIPAGTLEPGYNAVALSVQQRHRVDCSVPATYELWTKIDPAETGLVLPAAARGIAEPGDLAALLPRPDGSLPIHVVLSGKTNPLHLQRLIHATQAIALAGHALQPAVDFGPPSSDPYGADLALGTRAALGHLPQLADRLGSAGPLVRVVPGVRPLLVVTGSSDVEVDQAITMLSEAGTRRGSAQGLAVASDYPATATAGGTALSLRDLGLRSQDFDGRFFRRTLDLRLPADFLASDYGRGTFDLAGGYAAGLARGSQVRVDVNGRNAGIIKLPYADGDIFRHNQLFLPLSLMRPGLNRIDVIAETPRPEDAACASAAGRRFLLLDSSQIALPVLAHIERLPDLAGMSAGALPFLRGTAHLVVPKPDRETMGAALSLTARAAVTAGRVVPFRFATTMSDADDGSTLVVSPARQLDPALMTSVGLDPASVEAAWRDVTAVSSASSGAINSIGDRWWMTDTNGPQACRLPAQSPTSPMAPPRPTAAPTVPPRAADGDDLFEAWTGQAVAPSWRDRLTARASATLHWAQSLVQSVRLPAFGAARAPSITRDASVVIAQGMSAGSSTHVTTIVTAPDAATLRASLACLFDPQVWSQVRGRLATVDAAGGAVTTTAATSFHYVASGETSLANTRLVVAGWFSLNPFAFAAAALVTALWLSGTTLWLVRNVGRRPE